MVKERNEIESLKEALSITAVATRLGHTVVRGKIRCPFARRHAHGDRTPSVSLSEEKGLFNCWVCQDVRGDVIRLVEISKDYTFPQALEWLREEFFPWQTSLSKIPREAPLSTKPLNANLSIAAKEKVSEISEQERHQIVLAFLQILPPVENTPAAIWLSRRRIFKKTWQKMRLRYIADYDQVNKALLEKFDLEKLQKVGLFNDNGHLRYYKHPLIFPYLDDSINPRYFQARAIDNTIQPKELNLKGTVPFPYNKVVLDTKPGWVYLCEGVVDTLTLVDRGFNAVGIPGVKAFKKEWIGLFKNKKVVLCLDQDEAGRIGTQVITDLFSGAGIECVPLGEGVTVKSFRMSEGQDINDWFGGKK